MRAEAFPVVRARSGSRRLKFSMKQNTMISHTIRRSILRSIHLVFSIPILGYIYGVPSEVQPYAAAVRAFFVPVIVLSGFWMYSGIAFAVVGVSVWLAA